MGKKGLMMAGVLLAAWPASAQDDGRPLSAINWLSDSLDVPTEAPLGPQQSEETGETGAEVAVVAVTPLDEAPAINADALGILPAHVTGLPPDLWGASAPIAIAARITEEQPYTLPALQRFLTQILLAELDPPGEGGQAVFLARVDKLLEMGAVEEAHALLLAAGAATPEIVRRWFDAALLVGQEDRVCAAVEAAPDLSPTYPARVFCLARAGDWDSAVLVLGNARALGEITETEDALLARFLDPELFEGEPPLDPPRPITPLTFRLFEAIGEPIPTSTLPRAFAHADLRTNIGWKSQIEAGERLAQVGAIQGNQLIGLYTRQQPAASGGVWDRVAAVGLLDMAMEAGDEATLNEALPAIWQQLAAGEVEVPIAAVHGARLASMSLEDDAAEIAFQMGLLTEDYEENAARTAPDTPTAQFLAGVAKGAIAGLTPPDAAARAVADGFTAQGLPARFADLVADDRLGEAILRAIALFGTGTRGDLDDVADAIALFRAVGLESTARKAALEFLILDRRG